MTVLKFLSKEELVGNPASAMYRTAVHVARRRLQMRASQDPRIHLHQSGILAKNLEHVVTLWGCVAEAFGIEAGQLRSDDLLGSICRVKREDLGIVEDELWRKSGFEAFVEVHSYDLMHLAEKSATHSGWTRIQKSFHPIPNSEEEWIDRIMGMTLAEYVETFAVVGEA